MNNTNLSIIIPVYNAQKYLAAALESIIQTKKQNYELILIDDGSTDESLKICEQYNKQFPFIKVIHQENKGVSEARNRGIEASKGKYLFFMDADDEISSSFLKKMLLTSDEYDMVECLFAKDEEEIDESVGCPEVVTANVFKRNLLNTDFKNYNGYLWNKIFLSRIIKKYNLSFLSGITVWEDLLFIMEYLTYCKRVRIVKEKLYFYRQRKNSAVHDYTKLNTMLKSKISVCKKALKYTKPFDRLFNDLIYWYIRYNLSYIKHKILDKNF